MCSLRSNLSNASKNLTVKQSSGWVPVSSNHVVQSISIGAQRLYPNTASCLRVLEELHMMHIWDSFHYRKQFWMLKKITVYSRVQKKNNLPQYQNSYRVANRISRQNWHLLFPYPCVVNSHNRPVTEPHFTSGLHPHFKLLNFLISPHSIPPIVLDINSLLTLTRTVALSLTSFQNSWVGEWCRWVIVYLSPNLAAIFHRGKILWG